MAGHSVTVVKDSHITTASASATANVAAETEVTLTITPATGYEEVIEVLSGNATVANKKFSMPDADVVIAVKSKKNNAYRVTEETMVSINDNPVKLHRNVIVHYSANGAIKDTTLEEVTISSADQIEALLKAGLIEKV